MKARRLTPGIAVLALSAALAGCTGYDAVPAGYEPKMVGFHTCDVFGSMGERTTLRNCAGPDRPTLAQYHEVFPPRLINGQPVYPAPWEPLPQPGVGH
jgi:hypothetical protein